MNKNLIYRTFTVILGIPLVIFPIFLVQQHNFYITSALAIIMAFIGSREMCRILYGTIISHWILPPILTIICYFEKLYSSHLPLTDLSLIVILLLFYASEIKIGEKDEFKGSLERAAKNTILVIYPSYLMCFLLKFLSIPGMNPYIVSLFLLLVFGNDIMAYIVGMLFGRSNAGIFKVSPKKSIAGFVGSVVGAIVISIAYYSIFSSKLPDMTIFQQTVLGILMSLGANIGDLLESAFKRSAKVKDSGKLIPGRGGALDCLDSILSTAPLFYIFFYIVLPFESL
ncbi:MAG: phosphatidate cytidylyltransferase [Sphaerochaetaceae bacterium]|nr:phosphatidate cytidylyltransferase [Sphaerochaetaceae bacterium]